MAALTLRQPAILRSTDCSSRLRRVNAVSAAAPAAPQAITSTHHHSRAIGSQLGRRNLPEFGTGQSLDSSPQQARQSAATWGKTTVARRRSSASSGNVGVEVWSGGSVNVTSAGESDLGNASGYKPQRHPVQTRSDHIAEREANTTSCRPPLAPLLLRGYCHCSDPEASHRDGRPLQRHGCDLYRHHHLSDTSPTAFLWHDRLTGANSAASEEHRRANRSRPPCSRLVTVVLLPPLLAAAVRWSALVMFNQSSASRVCIRGIPSASQIERRMYRNAPTTPRDPFQVAGSMICGPGLLAQAALPLITALTC